MTDNQTSLTDQLYEKDIEIADLHSKLSEVESRIHFARTTVSAAKIQYQNSNKLYKALEEEKRELTSMLDWISDLLFYLGESSEDVDDRSLEQYKQLRDLDNMVVRYERINLKALSDDILKIRQDLLMLSGLYWDRITENKPCESIYEILIETAREAVRKTKSIRINSFEYD